VPHLHEKIGPQSQKRYHWKDLIFYLYVVRASNQFNGLWRLSRWDKRVMTTQQNKANFILERATSSWKNRTPKSKEVSLESSDLLLVCCEGESPFWWALKTLKVEKMVPWLHNQTTMNFEIESSTSPWTMGPQSQIRYHCQALVFNYLLWECKTQ
jgi:hypothetical protein